MMATIEPMPVPNDVTSKETRAVPRSAAAAHDPAALIGSEIGGYRLVRVIGRGGMGVVYAAENELGRVAIKVLAPELRESAELLERFQRESEALTRLKHPNLIEVYAHGVHEHGPYFVMELFEGEDLRAWITRGPTAPEVVAAIVRQAAAGLSFAHQHGIVHRDVKPANILVRGDPTAGGAVKVVDFGVAHIAAGEYTLTSLTSSALLIGTINYMAPEQRLDASVIDRRADVYALGVVAYELLTGKLPIGAFSPPSELVSSLPKRIDRAIVSALRQDPNRRFGAVDELAAALERAIAVRRAPYYGAAAAALLIAAITTVSMWPPAEVTTPAPKVEAEQLTSVVEPPPQQALQQQQAPEPPDPLQDLAKIMVQSAQDAAERAANAPVDAPQKKPKKRSKTDVVELK